MAWPRCRVREVTPRMIWVMVVVVVVIGAGWCVHCTTASAVVSGAASLNPRSAHLPPVIDSLPVQIVRDRGGESSTAAQSIAAHTGVLVSDVLLGTPGHVYRMLLDLEGAHLEVWTSDLPRRSRTFHHGRDLLHLPSGDVHYVPVQWKPEMTGVGRARGYEGVLGLGVGGVLWRFYPAFTLTPATLDLWSYTPDPKVSLIHPHDHHHWGLVYSSQGGAAPSQEGHGHGHGHGQFNATNDTPSYGAVACERPSPAFVCVSYSCVWPSQQCYPTMFYGRNAHTFLPVALYDQLFVQNEKLPVFRLVLPLVPPFWLQEGTSKDPPPPQNPVPLHQPSDLPPPPYTYIHFRPEQYAINHRTSTGALQPHHFLVQPHADPAAQTIVLGQHVALDYGTGVDRLHSVMTLYPIPYRQNISLVCLFLIVVYVIILSLEMVHNVDAAIWYRAQVFSNVRGAALNTSSSSSSSASPLANPSSNDYDNDKGGDGMIQFLRSYLSTKRLIRNVLLTASFLFLVVWSAGMLHTLLRNPWLYAGVLLWTGMFDLTLLIITVSNWWVARELRLRTGQLSTVSWPSYVLRRVALVQLLFQGIWNCLQDRVVDSPSDLASFLIAWFMAVFATAELFTAFWHRLDTQGSRMWFRISVTLVMVLYVLYYVWLVFVFLMWHNAFPFWGGVVWHHTALVYPFVALTLLATFAVGLLISHQLK